MKDLSFFNSHFRPNQLLFFYLQRRRALNNAARHQPQTLNTF